MSTIIKLRCIDQVLTFESTPVVASGGMEEDVLQVSFCTKWDGMAKTAVFWRTEANVFHVVLDGADACVIPREVLADEGTIYFGLFGVSADGRQRTSEMARYNVIKGAITEGTKPSDPTPDIYTQLLANYATLLDGVEEIAQDAEASRQAAEAAAEAAETAAEAAGQSRQDAEASREAAEAAAEAAIAHKHTAVEIGAFPRFKGKLTSADDCNNLTEDGIWTYDTGSLPANAPFPNSAIIMSVGGDTARYYRVQLAWRVGAPGCFKLRPLNGSWMDWVDVYTPTVKPTADDIGARPNTWVPTTAEIGAFPSFRGMLTSADDCNNIAEDGIWVYNTSDLPANSPFANAGIIMCLGTDHATSQRIQLAWRYGADGNFKYRIRYNGWREWITVYTSVVKPTTEEIGAYNLTTTGTNIPTSGDLNNYTTPGSYYAQNTNASSKIANAPQHFKTASRGGFKLIVEQGYYSASDNVHIRQTLYSKNNELFVRDRYGGSWTEWAKLTSPDDVKDILTTEKMAKIEVVSYVGTGTYGHTAPNSVTFSFAPKLVLALFASEGWVGPGENNPCTFAMQANALTTDYQSKRGFGLSGIIGSSQAWCHAYGKKSADGKTFYWYQETDIVDEDGNPESFPHIQLNRVGTTYYMIGIG